MINEYLSFNYTNHENQAQTATATPSAETMSPGLTITPESFLGVPPVAVPAAGPVVAGSEAADSSAFRLG